MIPYHTVATFLPEFRDCCLGSSVEDDDFSLRYLLLSGGESSSCFVLVLEIQLQQKK